MSHSSSLFNRVPIDLPNKSGFNLDHENLFTATCGTLTPAYCKPVLPGDKISMGVNFQCQLPPMVTDFYGKIDAVFEAFFVPNRLLWKGWTDFITHPSESPVYPAGTNYAARPTMKPRISMPAGSTQIFKSFFQPGRLADYLGLKFSADTSVTITNGIEIDALPFFAYHMIYDKWYRDTRIQSPVFVPKPDSVVVTGPAYLPDVSVTSSSDLRAPSFLPSAALGDGVTLGSLRQRNWSKGYFTTASPYAQGGQPTELSFDVVDDTGSISIAALRSANAIQQWKERNNFSYDYADQIYYQYGVYPSSAKLSKPIFLGRTKQVVYNRSVMQTAPSAEATLNDVVGAKKASSQCIGEGRLFEDFTPTEHGYLMVIFSLVPHAYYGTGSARHFIELESEDIPFPLLAGTGDQPIYEFELAESVPSEGSSVFGFTDRYAHYKYDEDEVHGLLRDGSSLESYCLQRSFVAGDAELGSQFLQIPRSALDQVQAVETASTGFSTWVDCFFKCTKVSTLPAYSLPTLGDIKNTHKGYASRGGSHL